MLSNPHVKETGAVYPCCGVSAEREIGNLYEMDLEEIMNNHQKNTKHMLIDHTRVVVSVHSDTIITNQLAKDRND